MKFNTCVLCGQIGSGKSTVQQILHDRYKMSKIISFTTRPPRKGEGDKQDYNFINNFTFDELMRKHILVCAREYQTIFGVFRYGISRYDIQNPSDHCCMILDPPGILDIYDKILKPCVIYLNPGEDVAISRALSRGDEEAEVRRRYKKDQPAFDDPRFKAAVTYELKRSDISAEGIANAIYSTFFM